MKLIETAAGMERERDRLRPGRTGLVPPMGYLHEGHLSLVRRARADCEHVVVSIFVNPTQFGPREDYNRYPRPIEADLDMCRAEGVDLVFNPSADEMYPAEHPDILIDIPSLTGVLEGKHRPGHFKGVCQVVAKLYNIITPDVACFGQKDYQQFRVLAAMVQALDWPVDMVPCPTVRDADGMALSSRNQYLSAEERKRALSISRALMLAEGEARSGVRQSNRLTTSMQRMLLEQHLNIDYVAAVDPQTLKSVDLVDQPTLLAIAARVGNTRLIDNVIVQTGQAG
jgi:pantoate--beta-alanine ligase